MSIDLKAFLISVAIILLILIAVLIHASYYPEQVFDVFKEDRYVCDERCPVGLIECKYEDGRESWGYCLEWHKKVKQ